MKKLLLEIGTEEIPAGYIEPALEALSRNIQKKLNQARIDFKKVRVLGTPRRLSLVIEQVRERQDSLKTEALGPPEKIGIDTQGKPTVAGLKFAEKVGVPFERISVKETPKGTYLCAVQTEKGRSTRVLLQEMLPGEIEAIPFPKTMKWADRELQFARPIHSIVCLLGSQVISFNLGHIKSRRYTFGHRFMQPVRIRLASADDYVEALRQAYVIVDTSERKARIEQEIAEAARSLGGKVLPDPELLDIVNHIVEYPVAVTGKFDSKFLQLPQEILITAMREHQKYFAVIDRHRKLRPGFVAVNNTAAKSMDLVAEGHERVLRARLEDARFFYQSDLQTDLAKCVEKLQGVLFQAKLGSMHAKTLRIQKLAEFIADQLDQPKQEIKTEASRAAFLCKADLISQVVGEFPKLQGIMGRVYARAAGEPEGVGIAIEEHYRPVYSGGALPDSVAGAIVSIADKLDSICGCFSVGLIPTGASDPYALRRQGIGIVQIMLTQGFTFSLRRVIETSLSLFEVSNKENEVQTAGKVYTFIQNRITNLLTDEGFFKDMVTAIVSISIDHIPNVWNRIRALQTLKLQPDFEPLAVAFKRVVNIIRQAEQKGILEKGAAVDRELLREASEATLFEAYRNVERKVTDKLEQGAVEAAMHDVALLREPVDAFFDEVLVMDEDPAFRRNRLALLDSIAGLFARFADFSKIST